MRGPQVARSVTSARNSERNRSVVQQSNKGKGKQMNGEDKQIVVGRRTVLKGGAFALAAATAGISVFVPRHPKPPHPRSSSNMTG